MAEAGTDPGNGSETGEGAGGGAGNQDGANGAANTGGEGGGELYRPDGLPDHLVGATNNETIDKLLGGYSGAREELSKKGTVPESAEGYEIQFSDKAKTFVGDDADEKAVKLFSEIAFKSGMPKEMAGQFFNEFIEGAVDAGFVEEPINVEKEIEALVPDDFAEKDPSKRQAEGLKRITAANAAIDGLVTRKVLDADQATIFKVVTSTAAGTKAIENLTKALGEHGLQTGGDTVNAGDVTKADLDKRVADPRNDPNSPKFEQAFYDKTTEMFKAVHGE